MQAFGGERSPVYYDRALQAAHHIHFPADPDYRLLQHHYGTYCVVYVLCSVSAVISTSICVATVYIMQYTA